MPNNRLCPCGDYIKLNIDKDITEFLNKDVLEAIISENEVKPGYSFLGRKKLC